jgi:hypothetical protein
MGIETRKACPVAFRVAPSTLDEWDQSRLQQGHSFGWE